MVMRCKTVEYAFPTLTTQLNGSSRNDFSAITLYIPETISRKFLSVTVVVTAIENEAASGTALGERTIGVKLGAGAFSDQTTTGENAPDTTQGGSYGWVHNFTSHFEANFGSGTSQTCQVGVQINTQDTHAVSAKLYITYQYDDEGQTTKVKTVRIPLESPTTDLTASLTEIGTNQVPQLSTFLPEASIVYRNIWFEVAANDDRADSATDFALELSLDAEAGASFGTWEMAQLGSRWILVYWVRDDMTTSAAHAFKARTTTATRMTTLNVELCVTYEYDEPTTSTVLQSLRMIMPQFFNRTAQSDSLANGYRSELKFMIEEPATITLKQSGVAFRFGSLNFGTLSLSVRAGGQSARSYTVLPTTSSIYGTGGYGLTHRIDSGGAQGAGISLARGENTLRFDVYQPGTETSALPFKGQAIAIINYTSAKHELGSDAHNHSTHWLLFNTGLPGSTMGVRSVTAKMAIPETLFWVNAVGAHFMPFYVSIGGAPLLTLHAQWEVDEGQAGGWETFLVNDFGWGNQNHQFFLYNDCTRFFARHPFDPTPNRMHPGKTRLWRLGMNKDLSNSVLMDSQIFFTYHALVTMVERGVTPAAGAVPVTVHRSDTSEQLYSTTTLTTGGFLFPCYTTSLSMFAQGYRSGVSAGRSFDFTPSGFAFNVKWRPSYLPNIGLWLRADLGVTQSGTISAWADQSGNANDGAQSTSGNRPTYLTDGGDGRPAASFDGSTDLIEVTDAASIGSTTAFSASVWIRTGATFPTDGTIIAQWGATERFLMRVETGGNLVVSISDGTAGTATVSAALAVSTWYLVSFTYDGAGSGNSGRLKVYVNAVQKTPSFSGTVPASTGNPTTILSIGSRNAASTYFNGYIGEVVFVNGRAMTEEEVLTHFLYHARFG